MKKIPVRVIKKNTLNETAASAGENGAGYASFSNNRNESPRSVAHKISTNVMSWVDEMRERKTLEMVNSFNLLSKATR
jgi:hypothetical protein